MRSRFKRNFTRKIAIYIACLFMLENTIFVAPVMGEEKESISVNSIETNRSIVSDDGIQSDNTKNEINIQSESFTGVDVSEDEDGSVLADYDADTCELRIYPGESGTKVLERDFIRKFGFNSGGYRIISDIDYADVKEIVVESGVIAPEDSLYLFGGFTEAKSMDLSGLDTSNVTDMSSMFTYCESLTILDLGSFDTSNVTDMSGMFSVCLKLESLDVSNFDTSNVTDMSGMFDMCSKLESLDVSNFDTSNVTDMSWMFSYCFELESLDLGNFDLTSLSKDFTQSSDNFMLFHMDSLELITTPKAISPSFNEIGVYCYDDNNDENTYRKLYDDDGNTYYYLPVDGSKTLHVEAIQSSDSDDDNEDNDSESTSDNSSGGSTSGNNSSGTSSSEATMVTEDGITHPTAVTFTGKKAKLDNVSIVYNGTTYSSGSIKFKYKNAKHAGTATAIIRKIIGDKEATKAFRGKSFTFVINPYEVSSNEVTTKTKKDGTIRKVKVTIGGKSRSVKKSMWSASGSEITFSGDYSGTVKVT